MSGPIVYFDLETGGLDRDKHPITQIAAVVVAADGAELETWQAKVQFDEREADPKALEINHYDPKVWAAEAIPTGVAEATLTALLKRHACLGMVSKAGKPYKVAQLAGHNAATFDGPFLQAWYKRRGWYLPADPRVLCTMQLAQWVGRAIGERPKSFKLVDCCELWAIPLEGAHDALADVRATAALARHLLGIIAKAGGAA